MKKENKKTVFLTLEITQALLLSLFSSNEIVNRSYYHRIKEFLSLIDIESYKQDWNIYIRLYLINEVIHYFIDENIGDLNIIYSKIIANTAYKEEIEQLSFEIDASSLSSFDIIALDNFLREQIKFNFAYKHAQNLIEISSKILNQDYENFSDIVSQFSLTISQAHIEFQKQQKRSNYENQEFSFSDSDLEGQFNETIEKLVDSTGIISTGIKYLNQMLDGGFKRSETTCFFGAPGKWKSGILLSCCLWAAKYNVIRPKDVTKVPTILYLSFENSKIQTMHRIISYLYGDNVDLRNITGQQVMEKMKEDGFFNNGINFKFIYRPSQTCDINDIEGIIRAEAEENNNEVVMLVVDYLRRMAPNKLKKNQSSDEYISLGDKSDDLANLAKDFDIPVIFASQLNRSADELIEKNENEQRTDFGKHLGRSKVSDSRRIIDNIENGFACNIEYSPTENLYYLTINNIKQRGKKTSNNLTYFAHPFIPGNGMRLQEDLFLEISLSKESISSPDITSNGKRINKISTSRVKINEAILNNIENNGFYNSDFKDIIEYNNAIFEEN